MLLMLNLNDRARALYDSCSTVKPSWDQLGDVTRSVWIERARNMLQVTPPDPALHTEPAGSKQIALF